MLTFAFNRNFLNVTSSNAFTTVLVKMNSEI